MVYGEVGVREWHTGLHNKTRGLTCCRDEPPTNLHFCKRARARPNLNAACARILLAYLDAVILRGWPGSFLFRPPEAISRNGHPASGRTSDPSVSPIDHKNISGRDSGAGYGRC